MLNLLDEREETHGDYKKSSLFIQTVKFGMRQAVGWKKLSASQMQTLDFNITKIGRILFGDANCSDHWKDISGYAELIVKELASKEEK